MFENVGSSLVELSEDKGISIDLLKEAVSSAMILAMKKKYGTTVNFHVEFDEKHNPIMYRSSLVVGSQADVEDKEKQISIEDAKKMDESINVGDEVWIIVDQLEAFGRIESQVAKNMLIHKIKDIESNLIYNEFKRRENQLVNGYFQREYKGNIYINLGTTEGTLLKRDQSPREHYGPEDRIRAYIYSVENDRGGHPTIYLTRTKTEFIKKLFELEIPEIAEGIIDIKNVVRQAGLKTKVAVSSNKPDVDAVGACIGQKGVRIQGIIKEIEGEKIDVIEWSKDIREYIYNALTPAKPTRIIITNSDYRQAMIIIPDDQLSQALGRGGYNIKLASQLTGYYFDLKTESDIKNNPELLKDLVPLNQIFSDSPESTEEGGDNDNAVAASDNTPVISNLYSLEGIEKRIIEKLIESGIDSIERLYNLSEKDIVLKTDLKPEEAKHLKDYLKEFISVVDENTDYEQMQEEVVEEIEIYECPNCGHEINENMTKCPSCGVEISFE